MFYITPCAVSAARCIITIFGCHILASFLHCTLNTEALHILIRRYFGVDMMSFEYQSQRHCHHKECHHPNSNQNYD